MLQDAFSIHSTFATFCEDMATRYRIYRAGIVRSDLIRDEFVMVSQWYGDGRKIENLSRRLERQGTVGDWVLRNRLGFVGSNVSDVRRFPATFMDFEEEGLQSNIVEFIDDEKLLLFFAVSREADEFANADYLKTHLPVMKHCLQLDDHFLMGSFEDVLQLHMEDCIAKLHRRFDRIPTQAELDLAYYRTLMLLTNGRVDGPNGAAKLAGVNASTFRSRMEKVLPA